MAISDKVIDLAPVNKTKKIIMFVALGVAAAAAIVFLLLYILKPSVTPVRVNSLTLNMTIDKTADDKYTVSEGCVYCISAEVGTMGNADATVTWEFAPSSAIKELNAEEAAAAGYDVTPKVVENGESRVLIEYKCFQVLYGGVGKNVRVSAKCNGNDSLSGEKTFDIVKGEAGSLSLKELTNTGNNAQFEVLPDGDSYKLDSDLIFYTQKIDSPSILNNYTLTAEQLGLNGAQMNNSSNNQDNFLSVESSKHEVILPVAGSFGNVRFRLVGAGETDVTVTANKNNGGTQISKTLHVKVVTSESKNIISKYYFYADESVTPRPTAEEATAAYYDKLDKQKANDVMTLYLGDSTILEDHMFVRPYSRLADFSQTANWTVISSDSGVVLADTRSVQGVGKMSLIAQKPGEAEITVRDRSALNAGVTISFKVKVESKVQKIEVSGATLTDRAYPVPAWTAQQNGSVPLTYTFKQDNFDPAHANCNLTVYHIAPDGTETLYTGKEVAADGITFPAFKGGVLPITNSQANKNVVTASFAFNVGKNVTQGTYKFKFVAGAAADAGGSNEFIVAFTVTVEPDGMAWKTFADGRIDPDAPVSDIRRFMTLTKDGDRQVLTMNLGDYDTVSLQQLIDFTVKGSVNNNADALGAQRVTVTPHAEGNAYRIETGNKYTQQIKPLSVNNDWSSYIEIELKDAEQKQTLATLTLYIRVVDNDYGVAVGRLDGNKFTPFGAAICDPSYNYESLKAKGKIELNANVGYTVYRQTWSGAYTPITAYSVDIQLNGVNQTTLSKSGGNYYETEGTNLFRLDGNKLSALHDFFINPDERKYMDFNVVYSLSGDSVQVPSVGVHYIMKRDIDALKLYTNADLNTVVENSTKTVNQNDTFALNLGAVFMYGNNAEYAVNAETVNGWSSQFKYVSSVAVADETLPSVERIAGSRLTFRAQTLSAGVESVSNTVNYTTQNSGVNKTLAVTIIVQNKSAKVTNITLTFNGLTQESGRYILDSAKSVTVGYSITYDVNGVYESYEQIAFRWQDTTATRSLSVQLGNVENGLRIENNALIRSGKPTSNTTPETITGTFTLRVEGSENGNIGWALEVADATVTQTYLFTVTTYLAEDEQIDFVHIGRDDKECTVTSGNTHSLAEFVLIARDSNPDQEITVKFPDNNKFPVDINNYTFSAQVAPDNGFITLERTPQESTPKTVTLRAHKVGTCTVTLKFTDNRNNGKVYTVTFEITVVANLYVSQVKHENDVLSASRAIALSVDDTNGTDKYTFEVVLNDGDSDRQPAGVVTAKLYQNGTEVPNNADISLEHYTITYKKNLTSLVGYQLRVFYDGTSIAEIPITLAKGGYVVSFETGSASAIGSEMDRPAAKVKQYINGVLTDTALTCSYALKNATTGVTLEGDKIKLTGKTGSATLVATYANGGVTYATAEIQVYLDNSVHSIDVTFDPQYQLTNGNNDVVWLKTGDTLNWTGKVAVKNQKGDSAWTQAYTVQVGSGTAQTMTSWTPSTAGVYTLTFTADGVSRTVTAHVIDPTVSVSSSSINAIDNDTVTFTVTGLGVLAGKGSLTVTETTALFNVNNETATATVKANAALTRNGTDATFKIIYTWNGQTIVSGSVTVNVKADMTNPTFAAEQKVGNDWVPVSDNKILYTDEAYRFVRTDNGAGNISFTGITSNGGDNTNGYTFSKGNVTVNASVTLYGVKFNATEVTYTVKQRDANAIAMKINGKASETSNLFYATGTTKNTVTVTLTNNSGVTLTAADFAVVPSNDCVEVATAGSLSGNMYTVVYALKKAGDVTFNGSVRVGGKWLTDSVNLRVNDAPLGAITATYNGGNIDPNGTVDLSDSTKLTVAKSDANNMTALPSSRTYEVIAGNGLVESLTGGVLKFNPRTSGGKVTVKVSVTYTDGYFKGQTFFTTFDITVNTIAAPTATLSYADANRTTTKGTAVTLAAPTVDMTAAGGSVNWTYACTDNQVTKTEDKTFTVNKYGTVTVTATGTVSGGAWDGYQMTVTYTITVPDAVEVTFSDGEVTPGESIDLNTQLTVKKNGEAYAKNVTYTVSGTAATLSGSTLTGAFVSGEQTVVVTATVTVDEVQYVRAATFTVLGLTVRDADGNVITDTLYIAPSNSATIAVYDKNNQTVNATVTAGAGVTVTGNTLTAGSAALGNGVQVEVTYAVGGKTYKAHFTVKNPTAHTPIVGVYAPNGNLIDPTDNVYNVTVQQYEKFTLTMNDQSGLCSTPYIDGYTGNALNVTVTKSGTVYTMTFEAVNKTTSAETVLIKYTENGSVYTPATLHVTVNAPATIGNITLTKQKYTDAGVGNIEIGQYVVASSYTYTVSVASGNFRYLSFEYDTNSIGIENVQVGDAPWTNKVGSVYDYGSSIVTNVTFTIIVKEAGNCNLRVTVGNVLANGAIAAPYQYADTQIVAVSRAFTANDIELPANIDAKTGDTVSIVPTLDNGFIADKITYSSGNGTVTETNTYTVTVYAAGVSQTKTVAVTFYAAPTITGLTYSNGNPTLTVKQGETTLIKGTDYTVVYSANNSFGTFNTTTGVFTHDGTQGGTFNVTATVVINSAKDGIKLYNGTTISSEPVEVEITKIYTEPELRVTVNDNNTLTISDDFTEVVVLSGNENVTVKNDNGTWKITNATLDPQTVTFTAYGKYQANDENDPYNGRIYQGTCTATIKADEEKAVSVEVKENADKSGGEIEVSYDPRLKNVRYEMSFTVADDSELSNYLWIEDGSTTYTYNTDRTNQNDVKITVTVTLIVNGTPREQTVEATITVPAAEGSQP